jgi:hypothetical protein
MQMKRDEMHTRANPGGSHFVDESIARDRRIIIQANDVKVPRMHFTTRRVRGSPHTKISKCLVVPMRQLLPSALEAIQLPELVDTNRSGHVRHVVLKPWGHNAVKPSRCLRSVSVKGIAVNAMQPHDTAPFG